MQVIPIEPESDDLWSMLHEQWSAVMRAANEAMRVWFAGDSAELVTNSKGKRTLEKLPSELSNQAYHAARAVAPELSSSPVADVCQRVRARYIQDRWACRVSMRQSVPRFPRPLPISIRTNDWELFSVETDGRTEYRARFPLGHLLRDARPVIAIVCKTARDFRLLERIASGEHERRTLEILPPGWERRGPIRAKIVYRKTVRAGAVSSSSSSATVLVQTHSDRLASAHVLTQANEPDARRYMVWNADDVRERIIAYERRRQRIMEDWKAEIRTPKGRRKARRQELGVAQSKHRNRIDTRLHQTASQIIGFAQRQRCSTIVYDDSDRGFVEPFPWHKLESLLKQKAEEHGLEIVKQDK